MKHAGRGQEREEEPKILASTGYSSIPWVREQGMPDLPRQGKVSAALSSFLQLPLTTRGPRRR